MDKTVASKHLAEDMTYVNKNTSSSTSRRIGVVGMGYVGTALSAVLAEAGHRIHGVDIDPEIVTSINKGNCPIEESKITDRFETYAEEGRITATGSYDIIGEVETAVVTVGTPLAESDPDLSAVKAATAQIAPQLSHNDIVIFRSTLPAGATEEKLVPILNTESELEAGSDYALGFCPERMAEGSAYQDLTTLPVVVGGLTATCQERIERFWNEMCQETVGVSNPTAAELTKLADNWWIDLNIALANELALLTEQFDVDVLEIIHAANTLPKGEHNVNILFPGAGVGGSCLIKDPQFVANLGETYGLELQTPRVSRQVNERMPAHVVGLTEGALGGLDERQIAVLGYAFKRGTDDTRNTPAKPIIEQLEQRGANVRITDPYVPSKVIHEDSGIDPVELADALADTDAIVVVTGHDQYRKLSAEDVTQYVGNETYTVVDGRHVFDPNAFSDTSVTYLGVGRGTHE
jgi:UDP-N-acetyl-D-mannosaminuronic acid dehydrogenase